MKTYDVLFEYRMQGEDSTSYDTRTVSIEIKATDSIDATDKLRNAFQQLVDSAPAREPNPPHVATVCAGCGRHGSSTEEIPPGQAALHWVVRGAWVCLVCYQEDKRGLPPLNRARHPETAQQSLAAGRVPVVPSRDEFIRALGNALDAYERQRTRPASPGGALHAAYELDKMHVAEARKLLALVKP